jgi:hypothetical protein
LNCDKFSEYDVLLTDSVENCDASAKNGGIFNRVHVSWNTDNSFCPEKDIFCVSSIASHAIDGFILTHLEHSSLAALAGMIMPWASVSEYLVEKLKYQSLKLTSMPWTTNSVTNLPLMLSVADGNNISDDPRTPGSR